MPTTESPLAEALPNSLEDYFSSSPLERKPAEWAIIVQALRAQRAKWLVEEASGAKRASAPKKAPKITVPQELTIDDLEI